MERREVRTKKASLRCPIFNFDVYCGGGHEMEEKTHSDLLPNQVRCILCGPSNAVKTNVMMNLLFDLNGLHFENVYVCSKSLYQPNYKFLGNVLSATDGIRFFPFTENEDVIHPKQQ